MVTTVVHDALKGLIKDLVATHGDNLSSVVLYGSAAAGDHNELRSDYNLLITLKRITPQDLREAQAPMREWQRLGNPLPVYFTTEELSDAADVFPIEFHQMADARSVLYGPDPFANLTFRVKFIRRLNQVLKLLHVSGKDFIRFLFIGGQIITRSHCKDLFKWIRIKPEFNHCRSDTFWF